LQDIDGSVNNIGRDWLVEEVRGRDTGATDVSGADCAGTKDGELWLEGVLWFSNAAVATSMRGDLDVLLVDGTAGLWACPAFRSNLADCGVVGAEV
jgi:hypothetical protein